MKNSQNLRASRVSEVHLWMRMPEEQAGTGVDQKPLIFIEISLWSLAVWILETPFVFQLCILVLKKFWYHQSLKINNMWKHEKQPKHLKPWWLLNQQVEHHMKI